MIGNSPDKTSSLGCILYGKNMGGKSSFIRAIGCNIILAQMGMFVSSTSFKYYPFTQLTSKITIQDDPLRGKSLFDVEMSEVKTLLNRSDNRSLILFDEMCSSTEPFLLLQL